MSRFDNTRTPDFTRASRILPSHRFAHSVGGPLVRVAGRIGTLSPAPGTRHGANLQGESVDNAEAYASQDNDPPLPVLHFTHLPMGYVCMRGRPTASPPGSDVTLLRRAASLPRNGCDAGAWPRA